MANYVVKETTLGDLAGKRLPLSAQLFVCVDSDVHAQQVDAVIVGPVLLKGTQTAFVLWDHCSKLTLLNATKKALVLTLEVESNG